MKITPAAELVLDLNPMDVAHFTGLTRSKSLLPAPPTPTSATAAVVRFEPGVRNHWHSHAAGQLILVVEGEGWVQAKGQEARRIRRGDVAATEPNEVHWHGAGRLGPMAHVVVNLGETTWLTESPPPPE
ncbi:MAG: cupin domain-containing protein [Candidatus Dormibacteraeota bacterium]|nr:cupin domain-containing protein [Candidatus Dormibacteraeota bacterium]